MDTIFMNSESGKIRILPNLSNKINLKRSDEFVALSNHSIYYTSKDIKKPYKNNKFKISAPMWNNKSELLHKSSPVSDIQVYFEHIIKIHAQRLITLQ